MRIELAVAGLSCVGLAVGHTAVGRSVLPGLSKQSLPGTSFGPPSQTLGMVRFTWHIVTIMLLAFGFLLLALASTGGANPKTLLLRWLAATFLAAAATAVWMGRRRPRNLLRPPVPMVCLLIAVMCWTAA